jgi:hypothetical protein
MRIQSLSATHPRLEDAVMHLSDARLRAVCRAAGFTTDECTQLEAYNAGLRLVDGEDVTIHWLRGEARHLIFLRLLAQAGRLS